MDWSADTTTVLGQIVLRCCVTLQRQFCYVTVQHPLGPGMAKRSCFCIHPTTPRPASHPFLPFSPCTMLLCCAAPTQVRAQITGKRTAHASAAAVEAYEAGALPPEPPERAAVPLPSELRAAVAAALMRPELAVPVQPDEAAPGDDFALGPAGRPWCSEAFRQGLADFLESVVRCQHCAYVCVCVCGGRAGR